MNKLDQLIKKLCPNGVEYKELGEVLSYDQPAKYIVKSTEYCENYKIPVLTPGQTFILGYTNEEKGVYEASKNNPIILFDDFTVASKWVDFNFKVKSSAIKILKLSEKSDNIRYIWHCIKNIKYEKKEHSRQWISKYSKELIPIPPLEVQEEIVRILDTFTELTNELTNELEYRKNQYEYYRNSLLTFDNDVEYKELGEITKAFSGGDLPKEFNKQDKPTKKHPYPIYSNGIDKKSLYGFTNTYKITEEAVTISARGTIGWHTIRKPFFTPIVRLIVLIPNKKIISCDYLNCVLDVVEITGTTAGIPQLTLPNIKKIKIPIPPLEVQEEIVRKLDYFDKLVNDISEGLPAEIEMRQQQYEYYRNKLLSFKKIN